MRLSFRSLLVFRGIAVLATALLLLSGLLLPMQTHADGIGSWKQGLPKKAYARLESKELGRRAQALLKSAIAVRVTPAWFVSAATPYVEDKAYLYASADSGLILYDASVDVLRMPAYSSFGGLFVFVHGVPGKATVVDCSIDSPVTLTGTILLGMHSYDLQPDPLNRTFTGVFGGNHITFAVPADVPGLSSSNWFALKVKAVGVAPANDYVAMTLYGCSISIVQ